MQQAREMDAMQFQFTPLREGRLVGGKARPAIADFNSRPYVRGDVQSLDNGHLVFNFNSRPYVRGDRALPPTRRRAGYFNSRPYVRGDTPYS